MPLVKIYKSSINVFIIIEYVWAGKLITLIAAGRRGVEVVEIKEVVCGGIVGVDGEGVVEKDLTLRHDVARVGEVEERGNGDKRTQRYNHPQPPRTSKPKRRRSYGLLEEAVR